jgi:TonB-linked SusC/RagA family outer membrane protein
MKKNKIGELSDGILKSNHSYGFNFIRFLNILKTTNQGFTRFICLIAIIGSSQMVLGQSMDVKISVLDDSGKPFEGVNIESVGKTRKSAITDKDGHATLNIVPDGLIKLYFSDMEKTVKVKSQMVKVVLAKTDKKINLGFGISKSVDKVTSAIDIVYANKLEKSSLVNPTESLYGQLTGLMVFQNSGEPWARNANLSVRGRGTLGNNNLLMLVDGFERDLSSLALSDVESVSVLKDGTALARYGERGANGVVLVTTKRGEYNSTKVNVSFDQGLNYAFRKPKFLNSYDYARSVNSASILDGNSAVYSDQDVKGFQTGENQYLLPNVNWYDATLKDYGTNANLNTNFSGGGKTIKYFSSLNYQNERGLFKNTTDDNRYNSQVKYDRFNFRTNLDADLTKTTKFIIDVAGSVNSINQPGATANSVLNAIYSVPSAAFPIKTEDGQFGGTSFYANNPVALVSSTGVRQPNGRQIMANAKIIQDLSGWLNGLSAEAAIAYDNQVSYYENKIRGFVYESQSFSRDPSTGKINYTNSKLFGSKTDLTYSQAFGGQDRHATLYGKANYDKSWEDSELQTSVMYHQDKRVYDGQYNTFLRQNMVASASYGYKNRYFVDGVLSYSGTSILPQGQRFGFFPAISAGWIVNRENFLKDSKAVDYLKLRASWGMSGNDIIAPNLSEQGYYTGGGYLFTKNNTGAGGVYEGRLASEGLTYENSIKTNIGVDMKLFGHFSMTVDAFYDKRENILIGTSGSIPSTLGVAAPIANAGEVKNRGIETSLLWKKEGKNSTYYIGGNFTFAKNKIVNMNEEFQPYDYLKQTGKSIGQQFGLQSLGFFKNQADIDGSPKQLFSNVRPGDVKYKDQNNDGVIDNLDVVPIGYANSIPEMYYALNFGYEIKGFGIDAELQGIANQTVFLSTKSVFWPLVGNNSISDFSANSWTPGTAETATLPRLTLLDNANNYRKSDIWLRSGDYLKLRRVEVYYNFPEHLAGKLKLKNAQIYLRGMNLFSLDAIHVADPESLGIEYPSLASCFLGVKLKF